LGSEGTLTEPPGGAKRRFSIDSPNGSASEACNLEPPQVVLRLSTENEQLKLELAELSKKYNKCKTQLEKYTNNDRHKRYYEQNKDRVKENAKIYLNKLKEENPEKLKEYRHRAYLKRINKKENA
jgi:hypothetical protein